MDTQFLLEVMRQLLIDFRSLEVEASELEVLKGIGTKPSDSLHAHRMPQFPAAQGLSAPLHYHCRSFNE
jgi:hypothetical protein